MVLVSCGPLWVWRTKAYCLIVDQGALVSVEVGSGSAVAWSSFMMVASPCWTLLCVMFF
jgi:hypothetical protein